MVIKNQVKTVFLLTSLIGILGLIGYGIAGPAGVTIALIIGLLFNFFTYWFSDKIVLKMYKAQELSPQHHVSQMVKELAHRAKIPTPKAYIMSSATPNAFATGRNPKHSVVAVTTGLLETLDEEEVKGVIAHELSHIKHRDTLIQTIVVTIATAVSLIANILQWTLIFGGFGDEEGGIGELAGSLVIIILAPIIATLIQLGISRSREYLADEGSARILKNQQPLISGLQKLEKGVHKHPFKSSSNSQTSSLFIVNPFSAKGLSNLFSTHPSTEDRIRKLRELKFQ